MALSLKFWIGITLLVTNQPIGWGAMFIFNALSINKQNVLFSVLGFGAYLLSWGMLGLGLLLAGPEGIKYSRSLIKKLWQFFAYRFS